jgi:nicotinamide riboside kinase
MKDIKIAIMGAQGSGKSTVLNALREVDSLSHYAFVNEIVRTLAKKGVKINKNSDHKSQTTILEQHYKNIWNHDSFITDRGALDAFVYATWDYLHGNFTYTEHKEHEKIFLDCITSYDYFFYIPIEFDIVPDGVRNADSTYQKEIDVLFRKTFQKYNISVKKLTGTCEYRVRQFLEVLN